MKRRYTKYIWTALIVCYGIGILAYAQSMLTSQEIYNKVYVAAGQYLRTSSAQGGGGSGGPFNLITTGTNAGQVLTVSTGSSLVPANNGVIAATKWDIAPPACGLNTFVTAQAADKSLTCNQPSFNNLSGVATDAQIPELNTLSTSLTPGRCVEIDGTGHLSNAAGACGTGGSTPGDAVADGSTKGIATFFANDFNSATGLISLDYANAQAASAVNKGFLTAIDWSVFNAKVPSSRILNTTSPLQGGGDLSGDRTLTIADAAADGVTKGAAAFNNNDFNSSGGVISIDYVNGQQASNFNKGFLSSADWTTFNNKPTSFAGLSGTASDAQIPDLNGLSTGLTPLRCVETDGAGRLTSTLAACGSGGGTTPGDAAADGVTKGVATFAANDFNATTGLVTIDYANGQTANASTKGFLSAGDWTTFNNKPTNFAGLGGVATDAQIPDLNVLSTGLLASRCVETDVSGKLTVSASGCNIAVDLSPYAKLAGPQILTQTQVAPRSVVQTITGTNDFTINLDITDVAEVPALAAGVTVKAPLATGANPRPYQELTIVFAPTTTQRAITWDGIFSEAASILLPTTTTGDGSTWNMVKLIYNATLAKYVAIASTSGVTRGITTLASNTTYTCNAQLASLCRMQATMATGTITVAVSGTVSDGTLTRLAFKCTNAQTLALSTANFMPSPNIPLPTQCPQAVAGTGWFEIGVEYSQLDGKFQVLAVN